MPGEKTVLRLFFPSVPSALPCYSSPPFPPVFLLSNLCESFLKLIWLSGGCVLSTLLSKFLKAILSNLKDVEGNTQTEVNQLEGLGFYGGREI